MEWFPGRNCGDFCSSSNNNNSNKGGSGSRPSVMRIIKFIVASKNCRGSPVLHHFLKSKEQEQREKLRGFNLNLAWQESDELVLGLGLEPSARNSEKGLGLLCDHSNSCIESENASASVAQKSSEGEYDPRAAQAHNNNDNSNSNQASETANSVCEVSRIDLNVAPQADADEAADARNDYASVEPEQDKYQYQDPSSSAVVEKIGSCSQAEREGQPEQSGLDLLVDAINLATGGLFEIVASSPQPTKKKKKHGFKNEGAKKPKRVAEQTEEGMEVSVENRNQSSKKRKRVAEQAEEMEASVENGSQSPKKATRERGEEMEASVENGGQSVKKSRRIAEQEDEVEASVENRKEVVKKPKRVAEQAEDVEASVKKNNESVKKAEKGPEEGDENAENRAKKEEEDQNSENESETISGKPTTDGKINAESQRNLLDWYANFVDTSPLVRSKRGRNQVLPVRFRDSVIEPWKRISRSRSKPVT